MDKIEKSVELNVCLSYIKNMAYEAIIFDLDGTLVESLPGIATSANQALSEHGYPTWDEATIRTFIGDGSWMLCRRAVKDVPDTVIDEINLSFKKHYAKEWRNGTHIFEGIHKLLKKCVENGVKISILSNKPHHFTTEIVDGIFPQIQFDIVMGQQEGIQQKPAPDGTFLCLEKLQVEASKCLFIGDSTIDIITANKAKTKSVAVTWGYHDIDMLTAENPTHIAHTVEELEAILFPC